MNEFVLYVQLLKELDDVLYDSLQQYYETDTCQLSDAGQRWNEIQQLVSHLFSVVHSTQLYNIHPH